KAEEIFAYVLRDMTDPDGGFYSAEDADSEGEEGKFYVWTVDEIKEVLGDELGELYCSFYDITEQGNFEHHNIPNLIRTDLDDFCKQNDINRDDWLAQVKQANAQLFAYREGRIHPYKDDKILTAWNSLMIVALAKGARILGRADYLQAAERAATFINQKLTRKDGRLLARYREGHAAHLGYLDDYSFWVWALLELYEATFEESYLKLAIDCNKAMIELFWDQERGGFYFYGKDAEELIARPKELYDGAIPSGNSVAALNLLRLSKMTGDNRLAELAERQIQTFAGEVAEYPTGYSFFLIALQFWLGPTREIVIAGDPAQPDTAEMIAVVRQQYLPQAVVLFHPENERAPRVEELAEYIQTQRAVGGKAAVYICENFTCQAPQIDPQAVLDSIIRKRP
ncbi:MAG: six-hairpin glycosidase-like family protein, partial [Bacilli bacterium]|nr:six-hairpin glycosidase-like family protein [Bacilli bacterium]